MISTNFVIERPPLKQPMKTFKPKVQNGNPKNRDKTNVEKITIQFTKEQIEHIRMLRM